MRTQRLLRKESVSPYYNIIPTLIPALIEDLRSEAAITEVLYNIHAHYMGCRCR